MKDYQKTPQHSTLKKKFGDLENASSKKQDTQHIHNLQGYSHTHSAPLKESTSKDKKVIESSLAQLKHYKIYETLLVSKA